MAFVTKEELDRMADEFCRENHVGRIEETATYKDLVAEREKVRRHMEEQRARNQPRQMMDADDVAEVMNISKSTAYGVIRRLNKELEEAGYGITVDAR